MVVISDLREMLSSHFYDIPLLLMWNSLLYFYSSFMYLLIITNEVLHKEVQAVKSDVFFRQLNGHHGNHRPTPTSIHTPPHLTQYPPIRRPRP